MLRRIAMTMSHSSNSNGNSLLSQRYRGLNFGLQPIQPIRPLIEQPAPQLIPASNDEEPPSCALCLEEFKHGDRLAHSICGHALHGECLQKIISHETAAKNCAHCRDPLTNEHHFVQGSGPYHFEVERFGQEIDDETRSSITHTHTTIRYGYNHDYIAWYPKHVSFAATQLHDTVLQFLRNPYADQCEQLKYSEVSEWRASQVCPSRRYRMRISTPSSLDTDILDHTIELLSRDVNLNAAYRFIPHACAERPAMMTPSMQSLTDEEKVRYEVNKVALIQIKERASNGRAGQGESFWIRMACLSPKVTAQQPVQAAPVQADGANAVAQQGGNGRGWLPYLRWYR